MTESFSLLIPAHNRPEYLQRTVDFYQRSEFVSEIIIADDSRSENKERVQSFLSTISRNDKIRYLDHYEENVNLYVKLLDGLHHVSNKYCVISGNDDYLLPASLSRCADFLENNPNFSCAHGYYITFHLIEDLFRRERFVWKPRYHVDSVLSENPASRVRTHFENYVPTFYAVHRTSFLQDIFEKTIEYTEDLRFGEFLPSMLTAVAGKIKRIDRLYAAREDLLHNPESTNESFLQFKEDGIYEERYRRFEQCLKSELLMESDISEIEAESMIWNGMESIIERYRHQERELNRKKKVASLHPHLLHLSRLLYEEIRCSWAVQAANSYLNRITFPDTLRDRRFYVSLSLRRNPNSQLLADVRSHALTFQPI